MPDAKWQYQVIDWAQRKKPVAIVLASETEMGWEFLQAWTDPDGKGWLFFRRPKPDDLSPR
jgi:hypothetical protein